MADLKLMLLRSLITGLQSQAVMQAEIIPLRHQLIVLQRTQKRKRLILGWADRCIWVWLSRLWSRWRSALIIVKPQTVIGWHRQGFQWYWTWKIRNGSSRELTASGSSSSSATNMLQLRYCKLSARFG